MGISGLLPFLKNASKSVHIREFAGQTAALDVYCFLHKGAFGCAEQLAQGKPTEAYVKYVMKFVNLLLYYNIKPILVFDGRNLPSKAETEKKRRENRKQNRAKAIQLLNEGKLREAREFFQRCVDITPWMAREVIQACRERNIDCIVSPYEADAQLAFLSRTVADFVITEDSDLTLFGCEKIVFKLNDSGEGILYEKRRLGEVFGNMADQFDFDKFRNMCIMAGCDYLDSLYGIGLAKSKTFWAKITNPNIRVVLPKIPHYLKMPNLSVSQDYINRFIKALNTFQYQVVLDPATRKERPLTDYADDVDPSTLDYCGEFSDAHTALQLALGNLDIHSLKRVDFFDPDHIVPAANPKYGTVAKHKSIWTPGFQKESYPVETQKLIGSANSKFKEVVVHTAFGNLKKSASVEIHKSGQKPVLKGLAGEKRKLEYYSENEVEKLLISGEESPNTEQSPPRKNPKLCSPKEASASSEQKFTRILGDSILQIENNTVSRYFGDRKLSKEETKELMRQKYRRSDTEIDSAGTWFDSMNSSATLQGQFIYRTEDVSDTLLKIKEKCPDKASENKTVSADKSLNYVDRVHNSPKPSHNTSPSLEQFRNIKNSSEGSSGKPKSVLSYISNSPPKPSLQTFQRSRPRNPFAVTKPLFKVEKEEAPPHEEVEEVPPSEPVDSDEEDRLIIDTGDRLIKDTGDRLILDTGLPAIQPPAELVATDHCLADSGAREKESSGYQGAQISIGLDKKPILSGAGEKSSVFPARSNKLGIKAGNGARVSGLSRNFPRNTPLNRLEKDPKQPSILNMFAKSNKKAQL